VSSPRRPGRPRLSAVALKPLGRALKDLALVSEPERLRLTSIPRSTWWQMETAGRAPKRLHVGSRAFWRAGEIREWLLVAPKPGPAAQPPYIWKAPSQR
jgi:predicted DNA-binding transcriptional regulator AlpA